MRPCGSPKSLEVRRRAVTRFLGQNLSLHEIARRMGCHASSVLRWRDALRSGGPEALTAKPAPGRPPRLNSRQKAQLVRYLIQGAMAHGYRTNLWTTQRIANLIERQLGVKYHRNHVGKLLHQMGWSHQKPERRTIRLAPSKKKTARLAAHLVFVDESGFLLIPSVRKTWSPVGQTPVLRHRYRHDRISAISGIAVSRKRFHCTLYCHLYEDNIQSEEVAAFLRHLLRQIRGHVIVLLDNGKAHRGDPVRELLGRTSRLHLIPLPPYAPELNPDEGVWNHLKRLLANGRPDTSSELMDILVDEIRCLAGSQSLLRGCIHQSDLPPFLP
jgi:transposase